MQTLNTEQRDLCELDLYICRIDERRMLRTLETTTDKSKWAGGSQRSDEWVRKEKTGGKGQIIMKPLRP